MPAAFTRLTATTLTTLALLSAGGSQAQEKIVLRVADSFPASGHYFSEPAAKYFMDAVGRATNGQVSFEHYPSEQLGKAKDLLALTVSGVVDIGSVMPSYSSEKMPLSAVAELPGGFASSCQGTLAYWKLARDGILAQKEYAPNGIRVLFTLVSVPYQVLLKQKFDSVKELAGRKLRSTGAASDSAIRKLNAVPVRMAAPEIYESLSRGTLDGVVVSYAAAVSYNLHTLVKSVTAGENFASAVLTYSMSEARWKSLPSNVQQAMLDAGDAATRRACALMDENTQADLEKIRQAGASVVRFSAAEKSDLQHRFSTAGIEWAKDLDGRGKPGTETLRAFTEAVNSARPPR
ncbi:TRAP transporter substrate-binding protein DctP [Piscinibacter sakaiensis]|uniref:TRAP transporter substrate-binding protein n=1 Tax=Piscinibacter sakaiensis TaxID=1547922 RepID=UPI003AAF1718